MLAEGDGSGGVRLVELVAALSLATDLGLGLPQEHVLRQTTIAARLAALAGLSDAQQVAVYYTSLLAWVGCVSDSHELAKWFGDEAHLRAASYQVDKKGLPMMTFMVGHVGDGSPPVRRLTTIARFLSGGSREAGASLLTHCQTAGLLAARLGLGDTVGVALSQAFERWDGKGVPGRCAGEGIDPVMRAVQIADDAEVFVRLGGIDAAVGMLRSRRGTEFDPSMVDLVARHADDVLGDLEQDAWDETMRASDGAERSLDGAGADPGAHRVRRLRGPEVGVVDRPLARRRPAGGGRGAAARAPGGGADPRRAGRAGARHRRPRCLDRDLGQGRTVVGGRARAGAHPSVPDRAGAGAATTAGGHRKRGQPAPRTPRRVGVPARSEWVRHTDDGPHRRRRRRLPRARGGSAASGAPSRRRSASRCCWPSAAPVASTAMRCSPCSRPRVAQVRRRPALPAGLTTREVEVLDRLVRGRSNKQIAHDLGISPRTVGTHVEHIYAKIGVSTRGAAALYAMSHGLVAPAVERGVTPAGQGGGPDHRVNDRCGPLVLVVQRSHAPRRRDHASDHTMRP